MEYLSHEGTTRCDTRRWRSYCGHKKVSVRPEKAAVSHIPQFGDATTSPEGDTASPTGDVDVSAGDAHL
jgi:hypothetical protein